MMICSSSLQSKLLFRVPLRTFACLIFHCSLFGKLSFRGHNALRASANCWIHWSRLECSLWIRKIMKTMNSEDMKNHLFTITRCARLICGLASGDDISSTGATHCSMNSLSDRASEGWLIDRCSDERWL